VTRRRLLFAGVVACAAALHAQGAERVDAAPGTEGGPGLALRARKILTCALEGEQVVDNGYVLVRDGRIEAVESGPSIPAGYESVDFGDAWLAPGMIDLHCHEAGRSLFRENDLNDMVFLTNPGLRASCAVEPGVDPMRVAVAVGITTVLYIPGSGTNIGGQGVLVKTGFDRYEENLVRDPGSLKLAQYGNPEPWTIGVRMAFENWNTRETIRRGVAYAERWRAFEEEGGDEPAFELQFEVFRDLLGGEIAISTHTQIYQVVLMTLTMVAQEFQLPVFLDHSTIGGWLAGGLAQELGVPAIVGPRSIDTTVRGMIDWARNKHEGVRGVAAGYQERGLDLVGFNTDAPAIPQESLPLQAGVGVRYGFDDTRMQAVRGLTIVPAVAARIQDRVGSLEAGKDADVIVVNGHPADPRSWVERVYIEGRDVYDAERDGRRW